MIGFFRDHWGDLASLAGLAVALYLMVRTKKIAEAARDAAEKTRLAMHRDSVVADFAAAVGTIDEVLRLHRSQAHLAVVLERCGQVRRLLAGIQMAHTQMPEHDLKNVEGAVATIRSLERQLDRAATSDSGYSAAQFNYKLIQVSDRLNSILAQLRLGHKDTEDERE